MSVHTVLHTQVQKHWPVGSSANSLELYVSCLYPLPASFLHPPPAPMPSPHLTRAPWQYEQTISYSYLYLQVWPGAKEGSNEHVMEAET